MSAHEKEKNHQCINCNKAFSRLDALKEHIKYVHEGVKDLVCDICGKSFGKRSNLKTHKEVVHFKIKPIRDHNCDECEKSFTSPCHLKIHKETIHEGHSDQHFCTCVHGRTYPHMWMWGAGDIFGNFNLWVGCGAERLQNASAPALKWRGKNWVNFFAFYQI